MINEINNKKDYLFSALIVGICLWAFSTIGAESRPTHSESNYQTEQLSSYSTNQPSEFIASAYTFPFNGNNIAINDFEFSTSLFNNNFILIFDSLIDVKFKSRNQKSLDIKPETSRTSLDYILSSNKGVEYQSIS